MAKGNKGNKHPKNEFVGWVAEVFIREVDIQGESCCCVFDPVLPFRIMGEDPGWIVFLQPKNLDASEVLPEIKFKGDEFEARVYRSNSRFDINKDVIDKDALIKLKQSHAKLRVGLKKGTNDILRMDVI